MQKIDHFCAHKMMKMTSNDAYFNDLFGHGHSLLVIFFVWKTGGSSLTSVVYSVDGSFSAKLGSQYIVQWIIIRWFASQKRYFVTLKLSLNITFDIKKYFHWIVPVYICWYTFSTICAAAATILISLLLWIS